MVCEEKGVAYRLMPARPHSPEVDFIHLFGKIPVMRYGDFHLFESKAIAAFVDRAFPGSKLIHVLLNQLPGAGGRRVCRRAS
jgi:glutathione S-transferase